MTDERRRPRATEVRSKAKELRDLAEACEKMVAVKRLALAWAKKELEEAIDAAQSADREALKEELRA